MLGFVKGRFIPLRMTVDLPTPRAPTTAITKSAVLDRWSLFPCGSNTSAVMS